MENMPIAMFGRKLIETGDLDPIYLMLRKTDIDYATKQRFCLAYWMFYHAGVAATCAEAERSVFWDTCWQAQAEKWPRGSERRHFKGKASEAAIELLQASFPDPCSAVDWVSGRTGLDHPSLIPTQWTERSLIVEAFAEVRNRVLRWRGFGPWISFKVADMIDAVLDCPVDFSGAEGDLFDSPVEGADRFWRDHYIGNDPDGDTFAKSWSNKAKVQFTVAHLEFALSDLKAPHAPQRPLGLQEYETILCKWKSHTNGRYPVGKDTREIVHHLSGWGPLAKEFAVTLVRESDLYPNDGEK